MPATAHAQRVLIARIGAYTAHSRHNGLEMTRAAREAFASKLERDVDPDLILEPAERMGRAEMARKAHFVRPALASAKARAKKARRAAQRGASSAGGASGA